MKLILEKEDIEKLIKNKFTNVNSIEGLSDDIEVFVKMDEYVELKHTTQVHKPVTPQVVLKKEVLLPDGTIDAKASGLTLESKGVPRRTLSGVL